MSTPTRWVISPTDDRTHVLRPLLARVAPR